MNILFMYDSPLFPEVGGTERATWLVMQELRSRGHNCMGFLHFNQNNPDEYFLNGERIQSLIDFLHVYQIDVVVNQIAFHYWLLKEFLIHGGEQWKKEGGRLVSFMHFDPTGDKKLQLSDLFRDFSKRSLWAKIKRIGLLFYLPFLRNRLKKIANVSYRYIYEHSDAYIVLSPSYIAPFVRKSGIVDFSKMCVITNMLTFPDIVDSDILTVKQNNVVVVARLDEKQKRISTILNVWKSIKTEGWKLQIIGTGKDESYYKEMASKYQILNVEFLGHRNPKEYYRKAKIFLMSSPREGWGLTITESMQNGTVPIVLNTSMVFCDIITDGINGFLPDTPKLMKERLYHLMLNGELCDKMAIAAIDGARRFTARKVGEQWEQMFNKIQ